MKKTKGTLKATLKQKSGSIINPLTHEELRRFFDPKSIEVIKYFIKKSLFSQPESKVGQRLLPIQIPKEHIEQWFTQAFNVNPVGAGSYPIDIYNEREGWGADIKMLNIKLDKSGKVTNSDSGEASLGQNFADAGIDLDDLFASRSYDKIKEKWITLYKAKYEILKEAHPIKKIYYFFILRPGIQVGGTDFYFAGAVLDLNKLDSVLVNKTRTTKTSVFLDNFISNEYGNTKIYKSKKRLELRLRPKTWIENDLAIKITTSFNPPQIDLRNEDVGGDYLKKQIQNINKIKIDFIIT